MMRLTKQADDILDPTVLGELAALSRQSRGDLLAELIGAFLDDEGPAGMERLRSAVDCQDGEAMRQAAHYLKGTCAVFGATTLVAALGELEAQARSGALVGTDVLLQGVEVEMDRVRPALAALRTDRSAGLGS